MESAKTRLAELVQGMVNDGKSHLQEIEEKLQDPGTAQETVDGWIFAVYCARMESDGVKDFTTGQPEWLRDHTTPLQVIYLLPIFSSDHHNLFASRHVKVLEQYIPMYNENHHPNLSLLKTLKKGYDMMLKVVNDVGTTSSAGLSKGQAKLAVGLSIAKLSIIGMQEATELQKNLLNSWIEDGITVDDVFEALNEMNDRFVMHKYLDPLLTFVELLNENHRTVSAKAV